MITNVNKVFKHAQRFQILSEGRLVDPVTLEIDLTNHCSNECHWCIDRTVCAGNNHSLDWAHLRPFLLSLKATGVRSIVLKGGGEPLMYGQASDVMYTINDLGLKLGIITNGQMIHRHRAAIVECSDWVRVSISAGCAERYDELHRPKGLNAFEKIKENMLSISGSVTTGVCFVANESCCSDLASAIEFSYLAGCRYIDIKLAHGNGASSFAEEQLTFLNAQICEAKERYSDKWFEIHANRVTEEGCSGKTPYDLCRAHALVAVLAADGHMYACCATKGNSEYLLGSIYDRRGFSEIWQDEVHQRVMASIDAKSCRSICLGRTSFARYDYYNSILQTLSNTQQSDADFI